MEERGVQVDHSSINQWAFQSIVTTDSGIVTSRSCGGNWSGRSDIGGIANAMEGELVDHQARDDLSVVNLPESRLSSP